MSTVKWNNAAVTPEGFNLQAELLQGGGIEFTRVTGADADGNNKITLSMQPSTVTNARITVPVLLSNTSLSEGFQMTQLRFYAKGTGGAPEYEILYAVAQDAEGDYIPSSSESPGFTIDWSYTFQFGNADNVTVELDPAGLVSFSTVGQPNGVAPLGADGKIPDEYLDGTAGSSIAPPYDPESTYDQGDYCTYNGALYQANVDIDTPEAWNESHWTAVSVTEQFIPNTEKGAASGVATLDTSGKLTPDQKPSYTAAEVGADEEGSAAEVQTNLSAHTGNTNNPHSVTAAQVGAIPLSQKGAPGGVAGLDEDGKLSLAAIPANGGSLLTVTFDQSFAGLRYTIAGGAETYQGVVPEGLTVRQNLLAAATKYDITVNLAFSEKRTSVMTQDYYTALQVTVAPFAATITVTCPAGSTVTCAKGDKLLSQTATEGTAVFTVDDAGTWTVTATLDGQTASGTVEITEEGQSKSIKLSYVHIYGVIWDGTSSTVLSRTNDAQDFVDPVPYVAGASEYGSPFDELMPWAGMTRVSDPEAGELVKIPKFWYKWSQSGNTLALQIADKPVDGFFVSPAHCDRGDGQGERDVVYVGRYKCGESDFKSQTKVDYHSAGIGSRSYVHALGDDIWMWDWAMNWTIKMLYLVEFADWNSQSKIGYGCGDGDWYRAMGYTDSMPYHTGTTRSSRTTYGYGTQYRYIEGLWDNAYDFVDGCYYKSNKFYVTINPNNFDSTTAGTAIGNPYANCEGTSHPYPTAFAIGIALNNQWIYPTKHDGGSKDTYTTDFWSASNIDSSTPKYLTSGGSYDVQDESKGLFYISCGNGNSGTNTSTRLMKLPNNEEVA